MPNPYTTGTVSIAIGASVAIGTGTFWSPLASSINFLSIGALGGTFVDAVTDDTHLAILPWTGGAIVNQQYRLWQFPASSLQASDDLVQFRAKVAGTTGFIYYVPAPLTVPDPSWGKEDDVAFKINDASFAAWIKTAGVWVSAGSINAVNTQVTIATNAANTATTEAGIATTQAGIATTQAGIATTALASITTQANAAAQARSDARDFSNATGIYVDLAHQWAERAPFFEVNPGEYSARHYATQAAQLLSQVRGYLTVIQSLTATIIAFDFNYDGTPSIDLNSYTGTTIDWNTDMIGGTVTFDFNRL